MLSKANRLEIIPLQSLLLSSLEEWDKLCRVRPRGDAQEAEQGEMQVAAFIVISLGKTSDISRLRNS